MFKLCNKCGVTWETRKEFLDDKDLEMNGYQAHFDELELGIFLFNHSCDTTLGIYAKEFTDLYDGPVWAERMTGSEECPGYCLDQYNLMSCNTKCECVYIRKVIQIIKNWKIRDDENRDSETVDDKE